MDYTTMIAAAVGLFMPVIISVTKQAGLNKWWNLLIALASCAVAGFLTVLVRGELNWADLGAAVVAVFIASQAVYAAFWKDSGVDTIIDDITSIKKKPVEA